MERKFDKDDILKYVYGELPPAEEGDLIEAMCADEELFAYYQEVKEVQDGLDDARPAVEEELTPSEFAVSEVLNYVADTRERHAARHAPRRILGIRLPAMGMVAATLAFVAFTALIYRSSLRVDAAPLVSTQAWDMSDLQHRMQLARLNASNLNGNREVITPVYSNTYRLIKTGDFAPAVQNVVLLSIE